MITRNLIYHVTPLPGWRWNVEQLLKRIAMFNGKRIVAVAVSSDPAFESPEEVRKEFRGARCELAFFENDRELRETRTFLPLLDLVYSPNNPGEFTFYGHTKGVTHAGEGTTEEAIKRWTRMLYHFNLDRWDIAQDLFSRAYRCVGAFKRYGKFSCFPEESTWHYTGTFFWFSNFHLAQHAAWRNVPQTRYGTEAYLSTLWSSIDAGCIYADDVKSMYNLGNVRKIQSRYEQEHERKVP